MDPGLHRNSPFKLAPPTYDYVIFDVSWVDFICPSHNQFYRKVSGRKIIEIFSSLPTDVDFDPFLWNEVDISFSEEELNTLDLFSVEVLVESIVSTFYSQLDCLIPHATSDYLFSRWVDKDSILLVRKELMT